jgi:uncharacterized repeat protein (TIGR03803 family)
VPIAGLVPAGDGSLLGTSRFGGGQAVGTVFKINPDGSGYQVLYRFSTNYPSAQEPWAALTPGPTAGTVFGAASLGGSAFSGAIFQLNPGTSSLQVLHIQGLGANLLLSWPGSVPGLQLQFNSDLSNPNGWHLDPDTPALINGSYELSTTPSLGAAFYRLAKP